MKIIERLKDKFDTNKHARTIESYNEFMKNHKRAESCYTAETNDCSGSCQGASDCLLARYYRGEIKKPKAINIRKSKVESVKRYEEIEKAFSKIDVSELKKEIDALFAYTERGKNYE